MLRLMVGIPGEETYSPSEASRILSRGGRSLTERRIRQMLQAGELEGERDDGGRWRIPRRTVHRLLEDRRETTNRYAKDRRAHQECRRASGSLWIGLRGPGEGTRALRGPS